MHSILKHISISNCAVTENGTEIFREKTSESFKAFAKSVYKNFGISYSKFYKMDKLSKLGFLACELLLTNSGYERFADDEIALVLANASSSLNNDADYQKTINDVPSPAVFVYTLPNIVIGEICIKYGFKGESSFFVQQTFDTQFMQNYVTGLLADGTTKQCITGWVEIDMHDNYNANLFLIGSGDGLRPFNSSALQELFAG